MSTSEKKISEPTGGAAETSSIWSRLYNGETDFDIVGRWKVWFVGSGLAIAIGLVSVVGS